MRSSSSTSRPTPLSLANRVLACPQVESALDAGTFFVQRATAALICMALYIAAAVATAMALVIGYLHLVFEGMAFSHSNDLLSMILFGIIAVFCVALVRSVTRSATRLR